ncbi:MAG: hypothetical protein KDA93_10440 [Planctomycetaceae bacterium]|nr:hypothetical protein [Planctomycetaceae bacterium]
MFWGCALVSLSLLFAGCNSSSTPTKQAAQNGEKSESTTSRPEQCERDIDNILDALQPDRYGISSDRDTTVNMLTRWLTQCGAAEDFVASEEDAEFRAMLLPADVNEQALLEQFTDVDAGYLRNSLLIRQLVDSTLTDEPTDIDRAVTLFYKVVHNIELVRDAPGAIELAPFQAMLYGRGTPMNRALIFAMMLRQLRIDVVILQPRSEEDETDRTLLLGVVIPEEGVYLFDCRLGLPLASPADDPVSPLPAKPATFAEAIENDAIFRQHDLRGIKYPVSAERLSDINVLAIGTSSTWAPRFGKLQLALPVPVEIYDGLASSSPQEPGLIARLETAGQDGLWKAENIGVWDYPDRTLSRLKSLTKEETEALQQLYEIMQGPKHVTINEETGQPQLMMPERNLHRGRISDLQGDVESALSVYVRSQLSIPLPDTLNQHTSDWSAYWAALAQFEQGDYSVAAESTERYLKTPGFWALAAVTLRANALAHDGHYDEAVKILEREPVRAPQYLGNQARVRRWRRLAAGESAVDPLLTAPPAEPETPPAEPEPTADEPKPTQDSPDDETPPDADAPRETPADLPPSDEKPDPRFEEASTDDTPAAADAEGGPDGESKDAPPAEPDTTNGPLEEEGSGNE